MASPNPNLSSFIWSVADLLRGDYKQSEYGKVILPFTVLRRLDCVLEPTKAAVLAEKAAREKAGLNPESFLLRATGTYFYNTSPLDLKKLMGDQDHIGENLRAYMQAFSPAVRDIFESFEFHTQIDKLAKSGLLYMVTEKFANIDLHPDRVSNAEMGAVFEELIRKFAELSNETAGEHFTPREVIRLMVNLLFIEDDQALTKPGVVRSLYDPTAGTGGMLSVAEEHLAGLNPNARLVMYGQELNPESYAICKADMLIKGQDIANIIFGNTLSADGLPGKHFDYSLSNPPFGVEWKKIEKEIRKEAEQMGFNGRFGPGLPRVSDGSLLFLLHLIAKMRPAVDGGSRFGIVLNGSSISYGIVQPGTPLDDGVPFVQTTNMTKGTFEPDDLQKTTPEIAAQFPRSRLSGGEVILGIRASIGAAHIVPGALAGANLSRGVARIAPNARISSGYLVAYFGTGAVSQYWQISKQGSTFNEVSIETVRELMVSVPPREQQAEIITYVERQLGRFDNLTAEAQRAIDLLQERRTALVSAAVTGQIDVRIPA